MDRLKQQGRWAKFVKSQFKSHLGREEGFRPYGPTHVKAKDYGKIFDVAPFTNKYVKKVKQELKAEYRAVKRSERNRVNKEIQEILLEI
jgi:hypothetical protein